MHQTSWTYRLQVSLTFPLLRTVAAEPGGPSSPPSSSIASQPGSASIFASATSIAAAAGRRAAAAASAAASSPSDRNIGDTLRQGGHQVELKCLEGYGDNVYVGRSDGVVEWWTCEAGANESKVRSSPEPKLRSSKTVGRCDTTTRCSPDDLSAG
jgi:hypothetical protein